MTAFGTGAFPDPSISLQLVMAIKFPEVVDSAPLSQDEIICSIIRMTTAKLFGPALYGNKLFLLEKCIFVNAPNIILIRLDRLNAPNPE
jgi:hypothetical protein